jgi:DNA-binding transcriptional regulator YdaS (Cro superfamily)
MITMSASERVAIAAAIGVNEQYLYQCLTGRRTTPSDRCPSIERATQGRVTCEELRADVRWHRVPDGAWPWHPQGRPLIDVARATPASQEVRDAA